MTFDPDHSPPRFFSEEAQVCNLYDILCQLGICKVSIMEDREVRIKIMGVKSEASGLFAIGTIKEDYLGSLN